MTKVTRNRLLTVQLMPIVALVGLSSRHWPHWYPDWFAAYAGDTCWALFVFLLFRAALPARSTWLVVALTAIFALAIELSQLYHGGWIDALRATTLGGLVLGEQFAASDLICYAAGIALGVAADCQILRRNR